MNPTNGKGSKQRPTDTKKFDRNFDRIFRNKRPEAKEGVAGGDTQTDTQARGLLQNLR